MIYKYTLILFFITFVVESQNCKFNFLDIDFEKEIEDFGISKYELGRANPLLAVGLEYTNLNENHNLNFFDFDKESIFFDKDGKPAFLFFVKDLNQKSNENNNVIGALVELKKELNEYFTESDLLTVKKDEPKIFEFHYCDLKFVGNISKTNQLQLMVNKQNETKRTEDVNPNRELDTRNGFKDVKLDTHFTEFSFLTMDEIIRKNSYVTVIWKSFPLNLSTIFGTEVKSIILLFERYKLKMIQVITYSEGKISDDNILDHYFSQMKNLEYTLGTPTKIDENNGTFMWVGKTNLLSTSIEEKRFLINERETDIVLENFYFAKRDGGQEILKNGF